MSNTVLIILILICIYFYINNCDTHIKETSKVEKFNSTNNAYINTDNTFINKPAETNKIKFDYEMRPIDYQFLEEQKRGVNMNSWYPNTWIEKFDEEGNPVYNSRDNIEEFIESKARFSYDFNKEKIINMDGVVDPTDFHNNQGKTLKEVYDNAFVDFKKLVPKMDIKNSNDFINTWSYENENPINGGQIIDGLFPVDNDPLSIIATF